MYYYIFIFLIITLFLLSNVFVWWQINRGFKLSSPWSTALLVFIILSTLSFFIYRIPHLWTISKPLMYWGVYWTGVTGIFFSVFIFVYLASLWLPRFNFHLTLGGLILSSLMIALALFNGYQSPQITKLTLSSSQLPHNSHFSLVQLTDLHLGKLRTSTWLKEIVNQVNTLKPDVILITGDLIDDETILDSNESFISELKNLKSTYGVYAVTGNHEYYVGDSIFYPFYAKSGLQLLENRRQSISDYVEIAGVNDDTAERFGLPMTDLKKALKDLNPNKLNILLNHKPTLFKEAQEQGVFLQLSGHTHAGQIPPFALLIHFIFKYAHGLYNLNNSYIYTSPGTGTWGPPMRLFSKAEMTHILIEGKQTPL